jgi:hypothetical protein
VTRFLRKPPADRPLLAVAAVLHVTAAIAIRVLPLQRAQRLLTSLAAIAPRPSTVEHADVRVVQAVRSVAAALPGSTCLTDALVAQCLLARYGCDSTLCFGIAPAAPDGRPFDAHAWLERDGATLIGARAIAYHPLLVSHLRCGPSPSPR